MIADIDVASNSFRGGVHLGVLVIGMAQFHKFFFNKISTHYMQISKLIKGVS